MLMIRVNVPLQISRGSFVCGEIIQVCTIYERNYTVIKQSHNENRKAKIINTRQFSLRDL